MKKLYWPSLTILITPLLCTGIAINTALSQDLSLSTLPNGNYFYQGPPSPELGGEPISILFQKQDDVATGISIAFYSENHCFKGKPGKRSIEEATLAIPQLSRRNGTTWEIVQANQPLVLDNYHPIPYKKSPVKYRTLLQDCLNKLAQ